MADAPAARKPLWRWRVEVARPRFRTRAACPSSTTPPLPTLTRFVQDNVAAGTTVHTDAWKGYLPLSKFGYDHRAAQPTRRTQTRRRPRRDPARRAPGDLQPQELAARHPPPACPATPTCRSTSTSTSSASTARPHPSMPLRVSRPCRRPRSGRLPRAGADPKPASAQSPEDATYREFTGPARPYASTHRTNPVS